MDNTYDLHITVDPNHFGELPSPWRMIHIDNEGWMPHCIWSRKARGSEDTARGEIYRAVNQLADVGVKIIRRKVELHFTSASDLANTHFDPGIVEVHFKLKPAWVSSVVSAEQIYKLGLALSRSDSPTKGLKTILSARFESVSCYLAHPITEVEWAEEVETEVTVHDSLLVYDAFWPLRTWRDAPVEVALASALSQ